MKAGKERKGKEQIKQKTASNLVDIKPTTSIIKLLVNHPGVIFILLTKMKYWLPDLSSCLKF